MRELIDKAKSFLSQRARAYQTTFRNPVGEAVLQDLARFCRASKSTFHSDPRVAAQLDGRREVWLRIAQHLNLSQDELWRIYSKTNLEK